VIVERFIVGDEHRLLVVGGRVVAAAAGESLWVTGDGKSTVLELCDTQINTDPRRGETEEFPLGWSSRMNPARSCWNCSARADPQSVPGAGQKVLIQPNGNVAIDVTDKVHPQVAAAASLAARVVGLDIAGIDLVARTSPVRWKSRRRHHRSQRQPGPAGAPQAGRGRTAQCRRSDRRAPVWRSHGPHAYRRRHRQAWHHHDRAPDRLAAANQRQENRPGLRRWPVRQWPRAAADGLGDWETGERLLLNKSVEAGVFESSARMILSEGLAYDKCAVGVVTDVSDFEESAISTSTAPTSCTTCCARRSTWCCRAALRC
jgi:cyanophycin synthetase